MAVTLRLPAVLADVAGGRRLLTFEPSPATVGALLDDVGTSYPALERRLRDETGTLRRFVNVYVGDDDVRHRDGLSTAVRDGDEVWILPSVAGG